MSKDFYEELAPIYHLKVDWENRSRLEAELFRYLLETYKPLRVLDVGCGDGGHATWFLKRKIEYVGVDLSEAMIARAKHKFSRNKRATFRVGNMAELEKLDLKGKFDLILNLGNSLPHVLEKTELERFMHGCNNLLAAGGGVVLQSINPAQLKGKDVFFPTPRLERGHLFSPIYIRRWGLWDFYMQIYTIKGDKIANRELLQTKLRLWSAAQLKSAALKHGLKRTAIFGSAQLGDWLPRSSTNIVMLLEKGRRA
jgi:SAM-dependent methyltransferase